MCIRDSNTGGRSGEPQTNDGSSESNSGRSRDMQQSDSRGNRDDEAVPGGNDAGLASEDDSRGDASAEQSNDSPSTKDASPSAAQDQQHNNAKNDRDGTETKSLSSDGVDDGEAIERILKNKQREDGDRENGSEGSCDCEQPGGGRSGGGRLGLSLIHI